MQRSPYPRTFRFNARNLNSGLDNSDNLMLIRQEQSQFRPNQELRETTPDVRFENLSQDSNEQEELIQQYTNTRNRNPTPNARNGRQNLHQSVREFEEVIPKIF